MHSTVINETLFIHNGDFSGDVEIRDDELHTVIIPFEDLKGFVSEWIRAERIRQLEDSTAERLFGL